MLRSTLCLLPKLLMPTSLSRMYGLNNTLQVRRGSCRFDMWLFAICNVIIKVEMRFFPSSIATISLLFIHFLCMFLLLYQIITSDWKSCATEENNTLANSYLHYITRDEINVGNFSFVPTCYFYGRFVTLNFTKWLEFFDQIPLPE